MEATDSSLFTKLVSLLLPVMYSILENHNGECNPTIGRRNVKNYFHRVSLRVPVENGENVRRQHNVEDGPQAGNVEASYFWQDWDTQLEAATSDHQHQMVDEISKAIQADPNQGHYGIFQMQFYNGQATYECGYIFFHDVGYSFHGGEAQAYLDQYCG